MSAAVPISERWRTGPSICPQTASQAASASAMVVPVPTTPIELFPRAAAQPFRVTRRPDGGLSIDVPPAMAEPLAGLLASLADALRASGG